MSLADFFTENPYSLSSQEKQPKLLAALNKLTEYHSQHCPEYFRILQALEHQANAETISHSFPMLPVRLFKLLNLASISEEHIVKTLTSSGTTSQAVSKIYLDSETAFRQTQALTSIITSFIGKKRLPMIFVDNQTSIQNRKSFSARGAGLMGMSLFGTDHFFLLDQDMNVRWQEFFSFLEKHQRQPLLIFGFTFMIWKYFYQELIQRQIKLNLANSILIHSGGWKKMQELAVDNTAFKAALQTETSIERIHNFYGMVEQVGSIYVECECGYLHAPDFADIIIRNFTTLEPNPIGQTGIVQTVSALPISYPGHSLLTEDIGTVWGEDTCQCGRKGKFFTIEGRLPASEIRGCSDTHAFDRRIL